jgi:hypothetical protein
MGVATQNSTHTQNPTFSGFDTQKILGFHTQYYTQYPKILGATVCVYE